MDRTIKNCGEYVEINSNELVSGFEQLENSLIATILDFRIELCASDKKIFINKFKMYLDKYSDSIKDFDDVQKSEYILRKMLLDG